MLFMVLVTGHRQEPDLLPRRESPRCSPPKRQAPALCEAMPTTHAKSQRIESPDQVIGTLKVLQIAASDDLMHMIFLAVAGARYLREATAGLATHGS